MTLRCWRTNKDAKTTPKNASERENFALRAREGTRENTAIHKLLSDRATKVVATNECPCEWEQATFPLTESFFTKTIPPTPTSPAPAPFQKETKTLSLCPQKKPWHPQP
jgi:hypothetical protein